MSSYVCQNSNEYTTKETKERLNKITESLQTFTEYWSEVEERWFELGKKWEDGSDW